MEEIDFTTAWHRDADTSTWEGRYVLGGGKPDRIFAFVSRPGGRGFAWVAEYLGTNTVTTRLKIAEAKAWAEDRLVDTLEARSVRVA